MNWLETPAGRVPQISAVLSWRDRFNGCKVRWSIGRNSYIVPAGLYVIGSPDETSPVIVTANYKMSYDLVRSSLEGRNVWLLVLETFGINVWCAAGKGTFGTRELVRRINDSRLGSLLDHRTLLLPVLGAPGVAAHEVQKETGFTIRYASVRASDLPKFLDNGMVSTAEMREVSFTLWERLVLTPVELVQSSKYILPIVILLILCGSFLDAGGAAMTASLTLLVSVFAGTVVVPAALPWLPGASFALKGAFVGFLWNSVCLFWLGDDLSRPAMLSILLFCTAVCSLLALNFTGCTPFTSLSGVRKEMRYAIPGLIATLVFSVLLAGWAIFI